MAEPDVSDYQNEERIEQDEYREDLHIQDLADQAERT